MTTDQLTGRALDEAAARAMGWKKPSERGCCDDCGWPLRKSEDIGCTADRCCMVGRDDGRADDPPQRTEREMLAWLHERGEVRTMSEKDWCRSRLEYPEHKGFVAAQGTDLREALARLVVAVKQREDAK